MATDRRGFLGFAAGALVLPLAGCADWRGAAPAEPVLAAGMQGSDFVLAAWDASGKILYRQSSGNRLHGFARHPSRPEAVVFERRPGYRAFVFDRFTGVMLNVISAATDRHFFGHGVYSPDGSLLYASENDYAGGRGVIGIYAVDGDYRRLGEFDAGGIGPHQVTWLPGSDALVVAVGGVLTHPDSGRAKLNLASMRSGLVMLDAGNGKVNERFDGPAAFSRLSLRHIAVNDAGVIGFGAQYYGPSIDSPPMIGLWRPGSAVEWVALDPDLGQGIDHYIGSVAFDSGGEQLLATAPRGNRIIQIDIGGGKISLLDSTDGCGVVTGADGVTWFSAGDGARQILRAGQIGPPLPPDPTVGAAIAWDNHLG